MNAFFRRAPFQTFYIASAFTGATIGAAQAYMESDGAYGGALRVAAYAFCAPGAFMMAPIVVPAAAIGYSGAAIYTKARWGHW